MQATDFTLANETRSYIFDRLVTCVHRVEGYQAALYDHTEGLESAKFRRAVGRLARKINEVAAELNFGNEGAAEKAWEEVEDIYETRCACVHSGLLDIDRTELQRTLELVAKTVEALLARSPSSGLQSLQGIVSALGVH